MAQLRKKSISYLISEPNHAQHLPSQLIQFELIVNVALSALFGQRTQF